MNRPVCSSASARSTGVATAKLLTATTERTLCRMSDSGSFRRLSLQDFIQPIGEKQFLSTLGQEFRVFRNPADRLSGLLSLADIEDVLCAHRLDESRLRVVRDGETCRPEDYTEERPADSSGAVYRLVVPRKVYSLLDEGATLIIDAIDEIHPPLISVARNLERSFREHVQINAYLSSGSVPGFNVHWDDHDALIVQLSGAKRWQVFDQTRKYPMFRDATRNNPPPTGSPAEFDMVPGDVLYLPRGWWHAVRTAEPISLHVTIGITHRTGVDLLGWLADESRRDEMMRRDLPLHRETERHEAVAAIRRRVDEWLSDSRILEHFLRDQDCQAVIRPNLDFRMVLPGSEGGGPDGGNLVAWLPSRSVLESGESGVDLFAGGQQWTFGAQAQAVLERLQDGVPLRIDDIVAIGRQQSGLNEATVRRFITELIREGLVEVVPPQ